MGIETNNAEYYQTQFELLKSRELVKRVVDELNLINHPELSPAAKAALPSAASDENLTQPQNVSGGFSGIVRKLTGTVTNLMGKFSGRTVDSDATAETTNLPAEATNSAAVGDSTEAGGRSPEELERIVISRFQSRLSVEPVRKTKLEIAL